jgi:hypothetical protein
MQSSTNNASKHQYFHHFAALEPIGCGCKTEIDGVNGSVMTMRWAEVSYRCCERHEEAWQRAVTLFAPLLCTVASNTNSGISSSSSSSSSSSESYESNNSNSGTVESSNAVTSSWDPHLSLAYDNPGDSPLNEKQLLEVLGQFPSLSGNTLLIELMCYAGTLNWLNLEL